MKMFLAFVKNYIFNRAAINAQLEAQLMQQRGEGFQATLNQYETPESQSQLSKGEIESFFDSDEHRIIWKWRHYFDIYEQHFSAFVGQSIKLMEIGVYKGGSLQMWQHYFGDQCKIFGVDIDPDCKALETKNIEILIGDQTDAEFWKDVQQHYPPVDILIDDGGHKSNQQITTFENMLMHINPGGIYLCEDIHGAGNLFLDYIFGLAKSLNHYSKGKEYSVTTNSIQQRIASIQIYPYVVVVKLNDRPVWQFSSDKKGVN